MELKPGLYIVSTPIGNLDDITLRGLYALTNSHIIFCEDTRTTQKLLQKHGILNKRLMVYNDHSDEFIREKIISNIENGMIVSLVSDAGTPTISDPGYKLIRNLQEKSLHIDFLPGPCAAVAGLVLSGLPSDKFYFAGFMPKTDHAKEKILKSIMHLEATTIFYEVSSRIIPTLEVVKNTLGNREVALARELTKMFQEVIRGKVDEILTKCKLLKLKGEFVLLIDRQDEEKIFSEDEILNLIQQYKNKGLSSRDIADILKNDHGLNIAKNTIYKMYSKLS